MSIATPKDFPYVCDVCGAPATIWALDMIRHEVPGATWAEYSPVRFVKYGCAAHPVESIEHVTQLPPGQEPRLVHQRGLIAD